MKFRCPEAVQKEKTQLSGFEFYINSRGVANVRPHKNKSVLGIVYLVNENDETSLDRHEGYPTIYTKNASLIIDAFYYIDKTTDEGSPRPGYLEKIIHACLEHHFPENYIEDLRRWMK